MKINLIAAVGKSGQIGLNGELPWHDREDLKWFQEVTAYGYLLAGHVTFESVRKKIHTLGRILVEDHKNSTVDSIRDHAAFCGAKSIFIIGGAKTYTKWMPYVDRFYISRIDYDGPADTYFPEVNWRSL
ncbi:dihydrofolate reductase [Rhizobium phage RHph_N34]|uniref:dihydrofolate reductase n=1 Tax=Rhizobium phage RHph_N34 TaxID=2509586 RepID=A0A7S5UYI9_9CAUD|nr:dihydrofolate reductase [Rhizobium phage RHph_N34]QIG73959.1 dihydrofolate reductase protein [Rhizobium phage RHph_N34]